MKNLFSFFILLILVNLAANAQQEPLFSNYMLSRPITNPGFAGADKTINALFLNRTMFAGMGEGKPVTSVFGVDAPFEIFGARSGVGLLVISDELGFNTNVNVNATYAYHHSLQNGTLGGGLSFGFNNYNIVDPTWITPGDGSSASGDPLIPNQLSTLTLSVGLGAYYATNEYYLGLSATNLNRADIVDTKTDQTEEVINYYAPHYYLIGAYNIALPDPLFDLQPSFLLRTDLSAYVLDLNGKVLYKKKYWGGIGLRISPYNFAAINFLGGLELLNGLSVGYAMDVNVGGMFLGGATSHEIIVSYSFNLEGKRDQKYKSVRYL